MAQARQRPLVLLPRQNAPLGRGGKRQRERLLRGGFPEKTRLSPESHEREQKTCAQNVLSSVRTSREGYEKYLSKASEWLTNGESGRGSTFSAPPHPIDSDSTRYTGIGKRGVSKSCGSFSGASFGAGKSDIDSSGFTNSGIRFALSA
jgi:hypothetical protein